MGALIVSVQTTMDGVMDQLEGWFEEQGDVEHHGIEELRAADAVLLGRKTYQELAELWPKGSGPYADLINPMPKYVASRTLNEPLAWNAKLLGRDTVEEVAAVKAQHPGSLISYGCGELASVLARHGLVDEVRFWLHPVVWGDGERPFRPGRLPIRLRLVTAAPYPTGVVRLSYQPLV
ncbi:Dihydrofolate reductase [Micromonospora sediminicola]|uniref:Dihydrofolate reductase n=1 Tax=Micromonospora sediminicola TaxID=946078 RepID=A0A1A9B8J8_9ACTN|nr:dihydrofolate reductase family protein [Micromonospora sediminicola]SBT65850.1 Dihydrofolate reductase [Micromonospora sediminicola]